ncbi:MAG: hypothetical protein RL612_14, partial [Actinomycetota bacterium]
WPEPATNSPGRNDAVETLDWLAHDLKTLAE